MINDTDKYKCEKCGFTCRYKITFDNHKNKCSKSDKIYDRKYEKNI